ncbi:hypothetical protein CDAR_126321 [Caerostris darwini]|uniref:Uncharacterized protein n=1 Tax=Caerostris darwini TaxID=1538125 RepID=A0AAV4R7L6_9ARAC|nr:hypothetical protein CDAR_126321 [Caerostris darwini]
MKFRNHDGMQVLTTHALRLDCRNNLNNPRILHAVPSWMRNRRACSANICFLSTKGSRSVNFPSGGSSVPLETEKWGRTLCFVNYSTTSSAG